MSAIHYIDAAISNSTASYTEHLTVLKRIRNQFKGLVISNSPNGAGCDIKFNSRVLGTSDLL